MRELLDLDHYNHIRKAIKKLNIQPLEKGEIKETAISFRKIIETDSIQLNSCTVKSYLRHSGRMMRTDHWVSYHG